MISGPDDYVMGNSEPEFTRLKLQADYLHPVTCRLINSAGIGQGMRVLDIGCGVGDMSMMLARIVGPAGQVTAIDRDARAVDVARARARTVGLERIEFIVANQEELMVDVPFDAAIGRYVLFHQADPIAMVRRAAACVRSGGVIAFHEMVASVDACAVPPLALWDRVARLGFDAVRAAFPSPYAGGRLSLIFEDAGLPKPEMFCESIVGGTASLAIPWLVMSYRTLLPVIDRLGMDRSSVGEVDTLCERLVAAAEIARTQFILNPQACAWVGCP